MSVFAANPTRRAASAADPELDRLLKQAVLIGLIVVLALPTARGYSAWFGWVPLWLLGMPLTAWWALHRFRLPQRAVEGAPAMRRRPRVQARRRFQAAAPHRLSRAA
ncbi:hypothetical protein M2650_09620 [Luteimonas sp. SX5]|uniref:Transmembrane protein n=1 Tax=Luteimonas galliterrae TaxID=2940486 RepID=A0ABT0MJ36_9GAMM|nr:hypothetical protein [Luteimonas galliterrae]MCL1634887.1 hypothetical protein [Luteimonas galliterrae]